MTKKQSTMLKISPLFVAVAIAAVAIPVALANPKKDERESSKAAMRLQRDVAAKCDSGKQHRGSQYQKVMREIHRYCGHDLAAGCSIEGKNHSYVLRKLTSKKNRTYDSSKRYPKDFASVLRANCPD